jgi:hypothetical protein
VQRRGWASFILFLIAILTFGALRIPYVINPASLGTASAPQLGFLMSGIAAISASWGTFTVMSRKESQLNQPINSGEPLIKVTFMQLLLFGVGMLFYCVDLIWACEEDSNHAQFSLLALALLLIVFINCDRCRLLIQSAPLRADRNDCCRDHYPDNRVVRLWLCSAFTSLFH